MPLSKAVWDVLQKIKNVEDLREADRQKLASSETARKQVGQIPHVVACLAS